MMIHNAKTNAIIHYIDSEKAWDKFIAKLERIAVIAIDIESNGYHCYPERICLIQIAFQKQVFLIDTLALNKLHGLKKILENNKITKIFHSCDNDVRAFQRDYRIKVKNIFDTAIAAKFLGSTHLGLANVLKDYMAIDLPKSKKIQKQNWSLRPLDEASLDYAASDVIHLISLKTKLERNLIDLGRLTWFTEECQLMEKINYKAPSLPEELFWTVKGVGAITAKQRACLKELCLFREQFAREINQPPYRLLSDASLLELALNNDKPIEKIKGLGAVRKFKKISILYQALKKGRTHNGISMMNQPSSSKIKRVKKNKQLLNLLRKWREIESIKLHVDPSIIWPMSSLEYLSHHPEAINQLSAFSDIRKWQKNKYKKSLSEALSSGLVHKNKTKHNI